MRKTAVLPLAFLSVVAIALAAGCANGNVAAPGGVATAAPSPNVACTLPPGVTNVQMVFPQPSQTGQPNLQGIVIAVAPNPMPTNWFFYEISGGQSSYSFAAEPFSTPNPAASPSASPLPTPSITPSFPNPIFESSSIGTFATSTNFQIYLANSSCYPGISLGAFTTASVDTPTPTPTPSPSPT
jgi:hypothetical protein